MTDKPERPWFDFGAWLTSMYDIREVGRDDLTVYYGQFHIVSLQNFLLAWQLPRAQMPWSLWLWTDDITLEHLGDSPDDLNFLERGYIFGSDGDLSLRRIGDDIHWSFVGKAPMPESVLERTNPYGSRDYWLDHVGMKLRPYERTALLWGEYIPEMRRWYQARVARADLTYPTLAGQSRVQIRYREYLDAGNVALVWHWRIDGASSD